MGPRGGRDVAGAGPVWLDWRQPVPTSTPSSMRLNRHERVMRSLLRVERWQSYIHIVRAYLERDYDLRDGFRAIAVPLTVLEQLVDEWIANTASI